MIKGILFLVIGLLAMVLQSTWLLGEGVYPFRIDLVFVLVVFLGTQEGILPVLVVGFLLGMVLDILSFGGIGKAMFLFPLIIWITHRIWIRTVVQSVFFMVLNVFLFHLFYGLVVYFFQTLAVGQEFSRYQSFLILIQSAVTMLLSLPLFFLFKTFFGKKPALV